MPKAPSETIKNIFLPIWSVFLCGNPVQRMPITINLAPTFMSLVWARVPTWAEMNPPHSSMIATKEGVKLNGGELKCTNHLQEGKHNLDERGGSKPIAEAASFGRCPPGFLCCMVPPWLIRWQSGVGWCLGSLADRVLSNSNSLSLTHTNSLALSLTLSLCLSVSLSLSFSLSLSLSLCLFVSLSLSLSLSLFVSRTLSLVLS